MSTIFDFLFRCSAASGGGYPNDPSTCAHDWRKTYAGDCLYDCSSYGGCDPTGYYAIYHCNLCGAQKQVCGPCSNYDYCPGR